MAGGVPKGAVLAFDLPDGCRTLKGWAPFDYAKGRTIIGAGAADGLSTRNYRDRNGREQHILTIPELAPHAHSGNVGTGGASFEHHQYNGRMPSTEWQKSSEVVGESKPFDLMNPFVVLHYCIKQ